MVKITEVEINEMCDRIRSAQYRVRKIHKRDEIYVVGLVLENVTEQSSAYYDCVCKKLIEIGEQCYAQAQPKGGKP